MFIYIYLCTLYMWLSIKKKMSNFIEKWNKTHTHKLSYQYNIHYLSIPHSVSSFFATSTSSSSQCFFFHCLSSFYVGQSCSLVMCVPNKIATTAISETSFSKLSTVCVRVRNCAACIFCFIFFVCGVDVLMRLVQIKINM